MEARQAITVAKRWVAEVLADEQPSNIGLEEIKFDPSSNEWNITIGFSRPWDTAKNVMTALGAQPTGRSYKVVRIRDRDAQVLEMSNRPVDR